MVTSQVVKLIRNPDEKVLVLLSKLRVATWAAALGPKAVHLEDNGWVESHDHTGQHVTVWEGDEMVAAARLNVVDRLEDAFDGPAWIEAGQWRAGPIANLSRRVVRPGHQGQGLGEFLIVERVRLARAANAALCIITTEAHEAHRLGRLGFAPVQGVRRVHNEQPGVQGFGFELDLTNRES